MFHSKGTLLSAQHQGSSITPPSSEQRRLARQSLASSNTLLWLVARRYTLLACQLAFWLYLCSFLYCNMVKKTALGVLVLLGETQAVCGRKRSEYIKSELKISGHFV